MAWQAVNSYEAILAFCETAIETQAQLAFVAQSVTVKRKQLLSLIVIFRVDIGCYSMVELF